MILDDIGKKLGADKSSIFHNYCSFYEEQLPGRDFDGRLLEIGVMDGLSMRMWAEYYPKAQIVGIDIKDMEHLYNDNWQVPRRVELLNVNGTIEKHVRKLGNFDIILDDASHFMHDQQRSFELLYYSQLNDGGYYIIEDLWTSYIEYYQNAKFTTVEYLKKLEKKGMEMTYYKHSHDGIKSVFPDLKDKLDSETVVIKAGQKFKI